MYGRERAWKLRSNFQPSAGCLWHKLCSLCEACLDLNPSYTTYWLSVLVYEINITANSKTSWEDEGTQWLLSNHSFSSFSPHWFVLKTVLYTAARALTCLGLTLLQDCLSALTKTYCGLRGPPWPGSPASPLTSSPTACPLATSSPTTLASWWYSIMPSSFLPQTLPLAFPLQEWFFPANTKLIYLFVLWNTTNTQKCT